MEIKRTQPGRLVDSGWQNAKGYHDENIGRVVSQSIGKRLIAHIIDLPDGNFVL
jgi:hypothetical protein